jgi:hypothetical protein
MSLPSSILSDAHANVELWTMAKRKRVESALLDETVLDISHHEQKLIIVAELHSFPNRKRCPTL